MTLKGGIEGVQVTLAAVKKDANLKNLKADDIIYLSEVPTDANGQIKYQFALDGEADGYQMVLSAKSAQQAVTALTGNSGSDSGSDSGNGSGSTGGSTSGGTTGGSGSGSGSGSTGGSTSGGTTGGSQTPGTTPDIDDDKDSTADKIAAVKSTKLVTRSKLTTLKGKKAVKVWWYEKDGDMDFDGYQVFRSTKRYSGFTKKPIFTTTKTSYYNTKSLKSGNTYYYKVRGYQKINGKKYYTDWSTKAWRTIK